MKFRSGRSKFLLAVTGLAFIFLLGMGAERIIKRAERPAASDSIFPQAAAETQAPGEDIPTIVEQAVPAVVSIMSKHVVATQLPPFAQDPFFRQFFGNVPREQVKRFLGSGVIVTADGYLLTNYHLVRGADEVMVTLTDKRNFNAKVVGVDTRTEVAVLKIDAKNLPTMILGTSSDLRLGQTVLAIGYPFGVGQTVTMGIVSGLAKQLGDVGVNLDVGFIQTDAAINPGNSGGALINTNGELIGINTLIISNTGSYAGLGFAIPIDLAQAIMNDIIQYGKVVRGYLGIGMDELTPEKAEFFGLEDSQGVIVTTVAKASPAMKAGIKVNDVVVAINGTNIKNMNDLRTIIQSLHAGNNANIGIMRDGKRLNVTAVIAKLSEGETVESEKQPGGKATPQLALLNDVGLEELNDNHRSRLQLPGDLKGIIVTEIDENSPAGDAGLAQGDVIVQVNLKPVANMAEFNARIKNFEGNKLMLTVFRRGAIENIVLKE